MDDSGNSVIGLAEVIPVEDKVAPSSSSVKFPYEETREPGRIEASVGSARDMAFFGDSFPDMAASPLETGVLVEGPMVNRSGTPWSGVAGIVGAREAPELGVPIVRSRSSRRGGICLWRALRGRSIAGVAYADFGMGAHQVKLHNLSAGHKAARLRAGERASSWHQSAAC